MADALQWTQLLYAVSTFQGVMHTWSCVQGYAHAARPVGLPESAVTSSEVQMASIKAVVGVSPDSFIVYNTH